jgi:hypothetical protein
MHPKINYSNCFTRAPGLKYKLAWTNKFFGNDFVLPLRQECVKLLRHESHRIKYQASAASSSPASYKVIGGGYEADTFNYFLEVAKSNGLHCVENLLNCVNTQAFADLITRSLGISSLRLVPKNYKLSLIDYLLGNRVYLNVKVSAYPAGSGIALHRDNKKKRIGMLLYLGYTDGIEGRNGGTQFYSDESAPSGWSITQANHVFSKHENLRIIHNHRPSSNSFVAFEVNDYSWHGVDAIPDKNLASSERLTLQLNFMRVVHGSFAIKLIRRASMLFR